MDTRASSSPEGEARRSRVWRATVRSRAAGKVSVLAWVETLLAVALYWWMAINWGTHWPLLGSVFLAPLLLLRSPESVKLCMRWFLQDGYGVKEFKDWPKGRRRWCVAGAVVLGCAAFGVECLWLTGLWNFRVLDLPHLRGMSGHGHTSYDLPGMFVDAMAVALAMAVGMAFAVALLGAGVGSAVAAKTAACAGWLLRAVVVAAVVLSAFVLAFRHAVMDAGPNPVLPALGAAVTGSVPVVFAAAVVLAGAVLGTALGLSLRAGVCRVAATLRCLPQGVRRLAWNWHESTFCVDSCVTAELLPGLRPECEALSLQGLVGRTAQGHRRGVRWVLAPGLAVLGFLAALVCRMQIKAACWFWWPLAYLLKPALRHADRMEAQQQALCWPWEERGQRLLILVAALVPAVGVCALLMDEFGGYGLWESFKNAEAGSAPVALQLVLGMQWRHVPPWHWALLLMQICGLGMLWIADGACGHKARGTWTAYAKAGMRRHYWRLRRLFRVRQWATVAFLLFGLGLCLVSFPELREWVPEALMQRVEGFFRAGEVGLPAAGAAVP